MAQVSLGGKATAEFLGTFWLTFGGCGSAVLAAAFRTAGDPALFLGIGLGLTLIHLISIPITNTSVNPARSTGPALFAGGGYIGQLWLFWVAPILGGIIAGLVYPVLASESSQSTEGVPRAA